MKTSYRIYLAIVTIISIPLVYFGVRKERELEHLRKEIDEIPWDLRSEDKKNWFTKWAWMRGR